MDTPLNKQSGHKDSPGNKSSSCTLNKHLKTCCKSLEACFPEPRLCFQNVIENTKLNSAKIKATVIEAHTKETLKQTQER